MLEIDSKIEILDDCSQGTEVLVGKIRFGIVIST